MITAVSVYNMYKMKIHNQSFTFISTSKHQFNLDQTDQQASGNEGPEYQVDHQIVLASLKNLPP